MVEVDHWNKGTQKKMTTSTTNELGKHSSKKVIMEVLETNNEKSKLVVGLWKTSRNLEMKFCH